jgi:6-phosphogluconate dehydrogenase
MGGDMVRRLLRAGHACGVYDRDESAVEQLSAAGATPARDLDELIANLPRPRCVWLMLPAGEPTRATIAALADRLEPDDVLVDGGNSHWQEDHQRARRLGERGIHYADVGTSGGVWGLDRGYCLMIGAEPAVAERLDPLFRSLAPGEAGVAPVPGRQGRSGTAELGYLRCGGPGAGHFVKMVHNGVEYGMMQAYAEGFDLLRARGGEGLPEERRLDLEPADIAELWRRGSVVGSWLLDLLAAALAESPELEEFGGNVADSGEGRWALEAAIESAVPAPVLSAALFARFRSRRQGGFADRLLSALRARFGGHREGR